MLTGYLYINFYNNTYTTAVCEVCACVRGTGGRVCGGYLFAFALKCTRGGFTVTSYAVSRGHPAPLVGKRLLADVLRVYFCLDSYLVYIHFAHTQDHDYVLYLCGGTSGIVWTVRFSLLSSKKMENEENSG